jgi:hypothetical protein
MKMMILFLVTICYKSSIRDPVHFYHRDKVIFNMDPGSGSRMEQWSNPDPGSGINHPGSATLAHIHTYKL